MCPHIHYLLFYKTFTEYYSLIQETKQTSTRIVHRCVRTKYEEVVISKENKDIFGKIKFDIWLRYWLDLPMYYIYISETTEMY